MELDTFKHKRWRTEMVQKLADKGIDDRNVLDALVCVPRHLFLETMLDYMSYEDKALPISCGQTISQPSTVAFQSQLLGASPRMKVLEVGTGSGYQTAVLCAMGLTVYTVERQKELYDETIKRLSELGYKAKCFLGDGYAGLPEFAPFDRVLVTCGAPQIPEALLRQLKPGGVMVIPVGNGRQEMLHIVKQSEDIRDIKVQKFGDCKFVPMLEKLNY